MGVNLEDAKWYVLHTYSGYENMVKENLEMVFAKTAKRTDFSKLPFLLRT